MVKNSKAMIAIDKQTELPTVMSIHQGTQQPIAKQSVLALNMKTWRELCGAYGVKEGDGVKMRTTGRKKKS